jgi:hypothetical protein
MKENMKISSFALLFVFQILALPARAGTIKEADYPIQYEVMSTGKSCSMTVRDRAKPGVALNVERKGYRSCRALDSGKVFRGRRNEKKNQIELVILVDEGRARLQDWQIIGTVNISPTPNPAVQ